MRELTGDPFYELMNQKYDRCVIRYCLMESGLPHRGFASHREAVDFAMQQAEDRCEENQQNAEILFGKDFADRLHPWTCDLEKAAAHPVDAALFLSAPEVLRIDRNGVVFYDTDWEPNDENCGGQIPYWYAFLEPPHGTRYTPRDFRLANAVLFPFGSDALEVYEWTTDWSDYFDDGHEWWGAACWSVYDPKMNRYAVLLASATD